MDWIRAPLLNANENELTVVAVPVREGEAVRRGQILVTLESTKAASDVEAPEDGYVRRLSVSPGQRIAVGAPLCFVTPSPDTLLPEEVQAVSGASAGEVRATAKAREMAVAHGIDLRLLHVQGIIRERDVQRLIDQGSAGTESAASPMPLDRRAPVRVTSSGERVVIFGASGHARVLIDLIREGYRHWHIVGAVDDAPDAPSEVLGVPVVGTSADLERLRAEGVEFAVLGIGAVTKNRSRVPLFEKLLSAGFHVPGLVHPRACVEPSARIGRGAQIFAGAVVGSAVALGDNVIVNSGVVVSHDCVIGSHVHLTPGAILAGSVRVGERSVVGMASSVYIGVEIGADVTIANGVHVMKNVPDGALVRNSAVP